ncbi:MAG: hypothetical protein Q8907_01485, partial [Bacteroidota bacterium]|nr:hypothetical protein [Bacteroidota bacterium]
TSTLYDSISANSRLFSVNDSGVVQTRTDLKQLAYAVRCVKDVVSTPTAGAITDAALSTLNAGFISRRDAAFEALRTSPLDR